MLFAGHPRALNLFFLISMMVNGFEVSFDAFDAA
jgi:hypothetical protein